MGLSVVTPSASYPVTLAEAKAQCRVDGTDEDALINGLIAAATAHVEERTGRTLIDRVYLVTFDAFSDRMVLPVGPVMTVDGVDYIDAGGVERVLSSATYIVDSTNEPNAIYLAPGKSWPDTQDRKNAVMVEVTCGYDAVPAAIKQAILLLIGDWYRNRESTVIGQTPTELPNAVHALLCNFYYYGN